MKYISILRYYLKGVRLSAFVLSLMLLWALFSGVIVYASVQYIYTDMDALTSDETKNASLLVYFLSVEDMQTRSYEKYTKSVEQTLEAHDLVEQVFNIRTVNPVSYEDTGISIILYEPEMLEAFPELKKNGVDFGNNLDGCILGSTAFNKLKTGDTVELKIRNQTVQIPVAGRLGAPYRRVSLATSSTVPMASYLFSEGDVIIMQETQQVMEQLASLKVSIAYDQNLIVWFKDGVTAQQREEILAEYASEYLSYSFEEMLQNSQEDAQITLKHNLPQPLFLAITALVAYFSIIMLTLKKKQKDMAILCLCGMSHRKYGAVVFTVCQLFTIIPVFLTILFLVAWPEIEWGYAEIIGLDSDILRSVLVRVVYYFTNIKVNISCWPVVVGYYVVTVLISMGVTIGSVARHTPLTYLRGAE